MRHNNSTSISLSSDEYTRRKEALKKLDEANISSLHIRACLVASAGFFADGYSLHAISFIVLLMLGHLYGDDNTLTAPTQFALKSSIRFGAVVGHLLFGILADRCGRKKMFGIELVIVAMVTVFSAITGQSTAISFVGSFTFYRFLLGIGIGGDYPISALIISELAPRRFRGRMLAAGFVMFTFGMLSAGLVSAVVIAAFRDSINQDPQNLDYAWRIIIGLGAIPAIIALFFRLSIPETPRYLIDVEGEIDWTRRSQIGNYRTPRPSSQSINHFYRYFCSSKNGRTYLLATSIIWFCVNFCSTGYRADALFVGVVLNNGDTIYDMLLQHNVNNIIRLLLGYVPGALLTVCLIDQWGRKPILYIGFIACAMLFGLLGFLVQFMHTDAVNLVYYWISTVALFFITFGPHTVAFVVPAELFPTRYRSTAYAVAASFGKVGSILSYLVFEWLYNVRGTFGILHTRFFVASIVYAIFMAIGAVCTTLLPETNNKSLEQIADDDEKNGCIKLHNTSCLR